MIKVDDRYVLRKVDYSKYAKKISAIVTAMDERVAVGSDFLGWERYPETYDRAEFQRIKEAAKRIRENYEYFVVCGIGGSYLGARAAIDAINGLNNPDQKIKIIYMGQTVSPVYIHQVLALLKGKKFAVNVISKSGTTTETAISFRLLQNLLVEQVGREEASKAIFATTDAEKGALLELAKKYGYERFVLPSDIGGRFSVFTAVGLLPMAVAGIDIGAFMDGMRLGMESYCGTSINEAYKYAILRHELYRKYPVEMFVTYEPRFDMLGEWWKQLNGESEGKEDSGVLPDSATFTTDLHSLGQFMQEGSKILYETVLQVETPEVDVEIPEDPDNLDGLNYLAGHTLDYVSKKAHDGTVDAHVNTGKVPNILLSIDKMDAKALGELFYFFFRATAISCYLNGVNPFNQPGVEVYKKNMFRLLGKPCYAK